jgi:prefoldin subunit 5
VTDSEFSSFEDALKKLELEEEDLKRLISAGEIRAFREGSNMRLRVEDVSKVAEQLGIGGSIGEDSGEVLDFDDLVLDELDDAGMATTQLSEEDTLLDDDVEELEVAVVGGAPRRTSGRATAAASASSDEGNGMRAALIFTCVVMIFAIPFAIGMIAGEPSGITASIVAMMGK